MTFLYPEQPPQGEAAQRLLTSEPPLPPYGQVSREQLPPSPKPINPTCPNSPPDPGPSGEIIRHVLIGSPEGVRATIYRLHDCRYVEQAQWTGPVKIGPSGVHITPNEGQILYYLMRLRSLDIPTG